MTMHPRLLRLIALCALAILSVTLLSVPPVTAKQLAQDGEQPSYVTYSDEYCLGCHGSPGQTFPLDDGSNLDLYVNPQDHANSIHGSLGYGCVQCHTTVGEYPHPAFSAKDLRDATIQLNQVCQRCHQTQYAKNQDSVHAAAQSAGNRAAAVCSDCHSAHAVADWVDNTTGETLLSARNRIPETCALCHNAIYQSYLTSVHGSALSNENNPDVPTCIDCHGVHNISNPSTSTFRLSSPQICAKCHTDPTRMAKYGISTDVLDTYVADFHGTTVTIFEKQDPDAQTNKPVCFDCHGVHDIKSADDPEKGLQVKQNMLAACQKCHPDANESFSTSWLSHYIPSPEKYPVVFYVDLFYKFFIPTVLGGMAILVILDGTRKTVDLAKKYAPRQQKGQTDEAIHPDQSEGNVEQAVSESDSPAETPVVTLETQAELQDIPPDQVNDQPPSSVDRDDESNLPKEVSRD